MRIAIVTESFLPSLNGVTTSVCRVLDCLRRRGHEAVVVAPSPAPREYHGFPVHGVASVPVRQFQVGLPTREIEATLADFAPDVVHVASPFFLGARGLLAARALDIPAVALYQTDMASYVLQHGGAAGRPAARATWRYLRWVHSLADLTLAPSSAALDDLHRNGIGDTGLWGRGVDTALFHPGWRDDAGCRALRRSLAPRGETVVGYVGRLAPEKEVERLRALLDLPGVKVAITGDGPSRPSLQALLPGATFLGRREGDDLARAYAACDVFVHTGTHETFGQTLQEAAATGLPVVAPRRGGPVDLVDHGRTGLLFDPDDADDLRRHVETLTVADDAWQRRAVMGEAALTHVAGRSWLRLVDDLIGHYAALARVPVA
ncbi:glycosyltransferase family 4 protein [Mobilicoccus pelagius]|uniref:D-inositol 3-phosphate glycosyltransferase n=1 Tax=Mobilicoccus pelagius NBRC 104925 TaxID=1089455 RepID=H5UU15_9MICO|nr:glycosyltransferase family 1 protein [Mobilicoccus pelagius]GAB49223.1 putative glycosyltransferase [Mobilicoccus pelagius NBRC 104925]